MCDFFDDFDDFGENGFMDDDSFEDSLEGEMDEPFIGDFEFEDKLDQTESEDDDMDLNPFIIGGAAGFGYEQGLRERKRRKRKRYSDDSN